MSSIPIKKATYRDIRIKISKAYKYLQIVYLIGLENAYMNRWFAEFSQVPTRTPLLLTLFREYIDICK